MTLSEYKLKLFKELITIDNENALKQIRTLVKTFLPERDNKRQEPKTEISFEEWNEQFDDNRDLHEFIPEYGTTLGEFRRGIYETEMDTEDEMDLDVFLKELKTW